MADKNETEKVQLHAPALEELRGVLQAGLETNFAEVRVSVVECPDLTKDPFQFPVRGLCGNPRITDVGGVPYLIPLPQTHKVEFCEYVPCRCCMLALLITALLGFLLFLGVQYERNIQGAGATWSFYPWSSSRSFQDCRDER